jgi:hypothetical protein
MRALCACDGEPHGMENIITIASIHEDDEIFENWEAFDKHRGKPDDDDDDDDDVTEPGFTPECLENILEKPDEEITDKDLHMFCSYASGRVAGQIRRTPAERRRGLIQKLKALYE